MSKGYIVVRISWVPAFTGGGAKELENGDEKFFKRRIAYLRIMKRLAFVTLPIMGNANPVLPEQN